MGDGHCEHEIAQGINPDVTRAVLSTTDAFRKSPRYVFALMPRNLGEETNTAFTTATSVWVKALSEAKAFHDTIVTFLRFIAAQTATSPLEEIEELKAGNCHCSTLLMVINRWTSLVPGVRQCWTCTTSVQDDALSSHQILKRGTRRLKSWRRSQLRGRHPFHAHTVHRRTKLPPCSRRLETAVSIASACSSTNSILHTTPKHQRPRWFPLPRRHHRQRRPSHPFDPALHRRRCAEARGTRESHQSCHVLGVRAEARSQCLPRRSCHSNL